MQHVSILVVLASALALHGAFAEDIFTNPENTDITTRTDAVDPNQNLSAAEKVKVDAAIDAVKTKINGFLAQDPQREEINSKMWEERFNAYSAWKEAMIASTSSDPTEQVLGKAGGFSLSSSMERGALNLGSNRHYSPSGAAKFKIIEANENLLAGENRRLQDVANKVKKSRFACGQFDWLMQLKGKFNKAALTKYVDKLAETAISAAPMAFLANWSPTLYEIVKYLRMVASMELNADQINCATMEGALTNIGQRAIRGPGYAECIKANQSKGVSEAARTCNQNDSPFDGVENIVGKIKGFGFDGKSLNLTNILSDQLRDKPTQEKTDALIASQQAATDKMNKAQAAADQWKAKRDAFNPVPTPGQPSYAAYKEAADNYITSINNAKLASADAADAQKRADDTASSSWGGFLGNIQNALADNLPSIVGNIEMTTQAKVQVGNQPIYKIILKYKAAGAQVTKKLEAALNAYGKMIVEKTGSADEKKNQLETLFSIMYGTMSGQFFAKKWVERDMSYQENDIDKPVPVNAGTVERLAVMTYFYMNKDRNSFLVQDLLNNYYYIQCMNDIGQYEIFTYLLEQNKKGEKDLMGALKSNNVLGGPDSPAAHEAEQRVKDYIKFIEKEVKDREYGLGFTISIINKYPLPSKLATWQELLYEYPTVDQSNPQLGK